MEQRRGGALPDRLIPNETQQQWTLGCDVDEARRRDGLLAENRMPKLLSSDLWRDAGELSSEDYRNQSPK
ncbi:hypothetical protein Scep_018702 [Stephania cephalantha]|uniref:Uncharacterized protein n=1 Tax=Stephania cephalantha TaxID=152367 RepID=A0AAP0I9T0_9MAGN